MPEAVAVLRHPDLPNQPIIVPLSPAGTVSAAFKDSGWVIDPNTDPLQAGSETPTVRPQASVAPRFESVVEDAAPAASPAPVITPAEPVTPEGD